MALTLVTSGSTTTDGTEQTLSTQTTSAVYIFGITLSNMVNGDAIEVKIKTKMRSGDSSLLAYHVNYSQAQDCANVYSVPIPANIEIVVTLKRLSGSDRAYPWALLSL